MTQKGDSLQPRYRIAAVAAMSGLPANTIRTWERRYGVVDPERSEGGGRRYRAGDVERLILLRRLTEHGHAIGELAGLSDRALRQRLERAGQGGGSRVGIVDPALAGRWAQELPALQASLFGEQDLSRFDGDALILGLAALGSAPERRVAELRERTGAAIIVLYELATRPQLARLAAAGAWLFPAPPRELSTLGRIVRLSSSQRRSEVSPREIRFDADTLARLMAIDSAVQCECPQHLASLVSSLRAFEAYSEGCAGRNAEDAALHRRLGRGTGRARRIMEELLAAVCEAEGLLPET